MKYARMPKAELRTQLHMRDATIEAQRASIQGLVVVIEVLDDDMLALRSALEEAEGRLRTLRANTTEVQNRGELLAKLRELTQRGVPCRMEGDFITHRLTRAVLAQVAN